MSREKLEALRKRKRLAELRAKKEGAPSTDSQEISQTESAKEGFIQGVTGGLSDEAIAATETGKQVLSDISASFMKNGLTGITEATPNIAETYEKHVAVEREEIEKARQANPLTFMASHVAGTGTSLAATMGLGYAVHGAKFAQSASGVFSGIGLHGFVSGIGHSEEDTIQGVINEGLDTAALGVAGEFAGPLLGGSRKALGEVVEKVVPSQFVKFLGGNIDKMPPSQVAKVQKVLDYQLDGKPIIGLLDSRKQIVEKLSKARQTEHLITSRILDTADDSKVALNAEDMFNEIYEEVIRPEMSSLNPDKRNTAGSVGKWLQGTFFNTTKEITTDPKTGAPLTKTLIANKNLNLKNLNQVKSDIYKKNKDVFTSQDVVLKDEQRLKLKVASLLRDRIEQEIGTKVDVLPPESLKAFQQANATYGALAETSDILEQSLTQDKGKNLISKVVGDGIQKYLGVSTVLASQASAPAAVVGATAMGLRALSQQPFVNKVLAKSADTIAKSIQSNPDKYSKIASRLASSTAISGEHFFDTLVTSAAQVDLMEQPLARSSEEVMRRQDSIITLVSSVNKAAGNQLREAIQNNDTAAIQMIMSGVSEQSKMGMVQPGLGWDGRAVTENDKAAVSSWLQGVKSSRQRMMLTTKFSKDGMIPEEMFAPVVEAPQMRMVAKKKKNKISNPEY